jgi:hypothetical protein
MLFPVFPLSTLSANYSLRAFKDFEHKERKGSKSLNAKALDISLRLTIIQARQQTNALSHQA